LGQPGASAERRSNEVNDIFFDNNGNMWCGTNGGIFRATGVPPQGEPQFDLITPIVRPGFWNDIVVFGDTNGRIWSNIHGLVQIVDGRTVKYDPPGAVKDDYLISVFEDARRRLLAVFSDGIYQFVPPSDSAGSLQWIEVYAASHIVCATEADDGSLWIGTRNGIIKYKDGSASFYTTSQGLSDNVILAISQDREGNIWIATQSGGLCELENESIVSFTRRDGLPQQTVANVVEDKQGRIYAATEGEGLVQIAGGRAIAVPGSRAAPFGNLQHRIIQDLTGYWWMGTGAEYSGPPVRGSASLAHKGMGSRRGSSKMRSISAGAQVCTRTRPVPSG